MLGSENAQRSQGKHELMKNRLGKRRTEFMWKIGKVYKRLNNTTKDLGKDNFVSDSRLCKSPLTLIDQ